MLKNFLKYLRVLLAIAFYGFITFVFIGVLFSLFYDAVSFKTAAGVPRSIIAEYNYLKSFIDKPDKKVATTTSGLSNFESSEWPVMTLSLFCYGARNLTIRDPSFREDASQYMRKAIDRVMKPEYYSFIVAHYGNPFESDEIKDNCFYLGHLTLMLALYREVSKDDRYDALFHKFCHSFHENFRNSPTHCLESYRGMCWTSEQVVPLRALKIHDDVFGTDYAGVIHVWERTMKEKFTGEKSGLLVTMIDKKSGHIFERERTIPNAWTVLFMHDILPDFCRSLYSGMKQSFLVRRLGFPMFREYMIDEELPARTGDTGPIIWGVSPVSTCFGMGCAALMGDYRIFRSMNLLADFAGLSLMTPTRKFYLLGGKMGTAASFLNRTMCLLGERKSDSLHWGNTILLFLLTLAIISIAVWMMRWHILRFKVRFRTYRQDREP